MKIFLEKVRYEISKAAECLESTAASKYPDVFRVQIENLQDSVSLFHVAAATKESVGDDFFDVLTDAQSTLQKLNARLDRAEYEEKSAPRTSSPNRSPAKSTVHHGLVEIPKFGGDYPLEFRSFMALFVDRVGGNSSLTNVEKFILLRRYLEGEAFDVINEIPITEENFAVSLDVLEQMYGHRDKYTDALFNRMVKLPAVSTGSIAEVRKTYWKLEAILRSLDQHGELINENGILLSLYSEKFVNVSGLRIENFPAVRLAEIRKLVLDFILAKEQSFMSAFVSFKKSSSNVDSNGVGNEREPKTKAGRTFENGNSAPSNGIAECIFCLQEHRSEECTVYPSPFQRKKQIQHLCHKCLRAKHVGKPCAKLEKCAYCAEDSHNRILCPQNCRNVSGEEAPRKRSDKSSASSTDAERTSSEPLTDDNDFHPTTPLTTCAVVELPSGRVKTSVRLVIASGSVSKISESAVDRLGLTSQIERAKARSNAQGGAYAERILVVNLLVHVPNASPVPLRVRVVEEVCDKTVITPTVAEFKKEHPHLADMDFPDTGSGLPIELLIGGDTELASIGFNSGLNDEECPRVNRGWSLASTLFGWIILCKDKSNEPILFSLTTSSI